MLAYSSGSRWLSDVDGVDYIEWSVRCAFQGVVHGIRILRLLASFTSTHTIAHGRNFLCMSNVDTDDVHMYV